MEGESWRRNAVANGMNPEEANRKSWGVFAMNAPFLMGSNAVQWGLLPKLGKGKIWAGASELAAQANEEGIQEGIGNVMSGKPASINPVDWFTDPKYESQGQAAKEGVAGFALPILAGMAGGAIRDRYSKNKGDEKSEEQLPPGSFEGKYWRKQHDGVKYEGAKPQTMATIDALGKFYYEKTGTPLIVTSVVDGDKHADGKHSHYNGWKVDVNDWGSGTEGALTTEDGRKGWLADEFIKYGQSLGLGMNWEGDHIDVAVDGTQWKGEHKGKNFGGFNIADTDSDEKTPAEMTKEEFFDAVAGQESGGNYNAENTRTGAFGKYQIMPENWSSWAEEAGLNPYAPMTPENQERVAQFKLGQYFDRYGAEGALAAWYAGEQNGQRWAEGKEDAIGANGRHYSWDARQGNGDEPSIREYIQQALGRIGVKTQKIQPADKKTSDEKFVDAETPAEFEESQDGERSYAVDDVIKNLLSNDVKPAFEIDKPEKPLNRAVFDDFVADKLNDTESDFKDFIGRHPELFDADTVNFKNSKGARKIIAEEFGDELEDFGQKHVAERIAAIKNIQTPQKSIDEFTNEELRDGVKNLMSKYAAEQNPAYLDLSEAVASNDTDKMREFLKAENYKLPPMETAPESNFKVSEYAPPQQQIATPPQVESPAEATPEISESIEAPPNISQALPLIEQMDKINDTIAKTQKQMIGAGRSALIAGANNFKTAQEKAMAKYNALNTQLLEANAEKSKLGEAMANLESRITDRIRYGDEQQPIQNIQQEQIQRQPAQTELLNGDVQPVQNIQQAEIQRQPSQFELLDNEINNLQENARAAFQTLNAANESGDYQTSNAAQQQLKLFSDEFDKKVAERSALQQAANKQAQTEQARMSKLLGNLYANENADQFSQTSADIGNKNFRVKDGEVKLFTGIEGNKAKVVTDSGKEHDVRYKIADVEDIIASHKIVSSFPYENKNYPQELQPRDRENRVAMGLQTVSMSNKLRPEDLMDSRNLNQGAPLVRDDGVVLNGNGRAMAIEHAYRNGKAEDYRNALIRNAEKFGFSREEVDKIKNPILVREFTKPMTDKEISDVTHSTAGGARMGAAEQAKIDAQKISKATLKYYTESENEDDLGDLTTAGNRVFTAAVLGEISGKNDLNAYVDAKGNVSADGFNRVKRALFALAYGDNGLISQTAESTNDNVRNITKALVSSAPSMAELQIDMKNGALYKYNIAKHVSDAVEKLSSLRDENKSVKTYLSEMQLFEEDAPEMKEILTFLDKNKRNGAKISQFLNGVARRIRAEGDPYQMTLDFGEDYEHLTKRETLQDIITAVKKELGDEDTIVTESDSVAKPVENVQPAPISQVQAAPIIQNESPIEETPPSEIDNGEPNLFADFDFSKNKTDTQAKSQAQPTPIIQNEAPAEEVPPYEIQRRNLENRVKETLKFAGLENRRQTEGSDFGKILGQREADGTFTLRFAKGINDAGILQTLNKAAQNVNGTFNSEDKAFKFDNIEDLAAFSKATRTAYYVKKDKPDVGNKQFSLDDIPLPQGFKTETGKTLKDSGIYDFIVDEAGNKNFGEITSEIENATGGIIKAAPIRLQVGNQDFGYIHLNYRHLEAMQNKGFADSISYIKNVLQNVDKIYSRADTGNLDRFILVNSSEGKKSNNFMPIDLELERDGDNYYNIISAYPHKDNKIEGVLILDGSTGSSSVSATDSLFRLADNTGGVSYHGANAKINTPSNENISQTEVTGKPEEITSSMPKSEPTAPVSGIKYPEGGLTVGEMNITDAYKDFAKLNEDGRKAFDAATNKPVVYNGKEIPRHELIEKIATGEADESALKFTEGDRKFHSYVKEQLVKPLQAIQQAGIDSERSPQNYSPAKSNADTVYFKGLENDARTTENLEKLASSMGGALQRNSNGKVSFKFDNGKAANEFSTAANLFTNNTHADYFKAEQENIPTAQDENAESAEPSASKIKYPEGSLVFGKMKAADAYKDAVLLTDEEQRNFDERMNKTVKYDNQEMTRRELIEKIAKGEIDESAAKTTKGEQRYLNFLHTELIVPLKAIERAGLENETSRKNYSFSNEDNSDSRGNGAYNSIVFRDKSLAEDIDTMNNLKKLATAFDGGFKESSQGIKFWGRKNPKEPFEFSDAVSMFLENRHLPYFKAEEGANATEEPYKITPSKAEEDAKWREESEKKRAKEEAGWRERAERNRETRKILERLPIKLNENTWVQEPYFSTNFESPKEFEEYMSEYDHAEVKVNEDGSISNSRGKEYPYVLKKVDDHWEAGFYYDKSAGVIPELYREFKAGQIYKDDAVAQDLYQKTSEIPNAKKKLDGWLKIIRNDKLMQRNNPYHKDVQNWETAKDRLDAIRLRGRDGVFAALAGEKQSDWWALQDRTENWNTSAESHEVRDKLRQVRLDYWEGKISGEEVYNRYSEILDSDTKRLKEIIAENEKAERAAKDKAAEELTETQEDIERPKALPKWIPDRVKEAQIYKDDAKIQDLYKKVEHSPEAAANINELLKTVRNDKLIEGKQYYDEDTNRWLTADSRLGWLMSKVKNDEDFWHTLTMQEIDDWTAETAKKRSMSQSKFMQTDEHSKAWSKFHSVFNDKKLSHEDKYKQIHALLNSKELKKSDAENISEVTTPAESKQAQELTPSKESESVNPQRYFSPRSETKRRVLEKMGWTEDETDNAAATNTDNAQNGKQTESEKGGEKLHLKPKMFVDNSKENRERVIAELNKELNKLSANPFFNPKVYTLGLELGAIYVQDGIDNISEWTRKMIESAGEKIRPWLSAIKDTINAIPEDTKFNDEQLTAIAEHIGAVMEDTSTRSLDDVISSFEQDFGKERTAQVTPMIKAAYIGISKFFEENAQHAENQQAAEEGVTFNQGTNYEYTIRNSDLPQGYSTSSGRKLIESGKEEFIVRPNGNYDFGRIGLQKVEKANEQIKKLGIKGEVKDVPIRLQVGIPDRADRDGFGFMHIMAHVDNIKARGFQNIPDYVDHILKNFNQIYKATDDDNRITLYCKGDESKGLMPLDLDLGKDYYTIVTAYPRRRANKNEALILDTRPTNVPADAASALREMDGNNNNGVTSTRDIAEENAPRENISQAAENDKPSVNDAEIESRAREALKSAGLEGKISSGKFLTAFDSIGFDSIGFVILKQKDRNKDMEEVEQDFDDIYPDLIKLCDVFGADWNPKYYTDLYCIFEGMSKEDRPVFKRALDIYLGAGQNEQRQLGESGRLDGGHSGEQSDVRKAAAEGTRQEGRDSVSEEISGQERRDIRKSESDDTGADGTGARSVSANGAEEAGARTGAGNGARGSEGALRAAGRTAERPDDGVLENAQPAISNPAEIPGHNFHITDESGVGEGGLKTKFKQNIDAINLLKQLEAEGRMATPSEQAILAKFNGWGTLADAFTDNEKWQKENQQLKELLTGDEYRAAKAAIINAYYTHPKIAQAIWQGLKQIGFTGGRILDPSMGTGIFFGTMPSEIMAKSELSGVELDDLTGRIAKQLYQKADVEITGFQDRRLPNNYFDVAISNVPFADIAIYSDPEYRKQGYKLHNFFFAKAMDKVRAGGFVAFITSTGTMQSRNTDAQRLRSEIGRKADLIATFKLPSNAFDKNAGTQVTTDVLILQKRLDPNKPSKYAQNWEIIDNIDAEAKTLDGQRR